MRKKGILSGYNYIVDFDMLLEELLLEISSQLVGTRAANTSFDSGILGGEVVPLKEKYLEEGWEVINGRAVSPVIDERIIRSFMYTDCYDEWYFFDEVPDVMYIEAFCNWGADGFEEAESYETLETKGFNLLSALHNYKPVAVAGWNADISYYLTKVDNT